MQKIIIPVDDKIAQIWENAAPAHRAQITRLFSWLIEQDARFLSKLSREEAGKVWQEKKYTDESVDQWLKGE